MVSALRKRDYGESGTQTASEKRSQLAAGGDTPVFHHSIIPLFQSDADCAKRTHFADLATGLAAARPELGSFVQQMAGGEMAASLPDELRQFLERLRAAIQERRRPRPPCAPG